MADGKEKAVPCKRGVYITYRNRDMRSNILLHLQALRDRRLQRQFMGGCLLVGIASVIRDGRSWADGRCFWAYTHASSPWFIKL